MRVVGGMKCTLSDSLPEKSFWFFRNLGPFTLPISTALISGRASPFLVCYWLFLALFLAILNSPSLFNPVSPVSSETLHAFCTLSSICACYSVLLNTLPWAYFYTFFSLNVNSFRKLSLVLTKWYFFLKDCISTPLLTEESPAHPFWVSFDYKFH